MADPVAAGQLISGFYGLEGQEWRWTAKKFSVALKPPSDAARNGAKLVLRVYFPDVEIDQVGALTLTADVAGQPIAPQTFSKSGLYMYSRDVTGAVLDSNVVPVSFAFDKSIPPSPGSRELGGVVSYVGLQTK